MSLMAGVVRRRPDAPPIEALGTRLRGALSRLHDSRVEVIRGADHCFLKCDFGAFGEPGTYQDQDGSVSLLCGEPLLKNGAGKGRVDDLRVLHRELSRGNGSGLRDACGTFTLAHFDANTTTLTLAVDRMGIRPLYFWVGRDYVVFASALRILEVVAQIPKDIDVQGVTEEAAFGFSLGDRTAYSACKLLKSGEIVVTTRDTLRRSFYARWDEIALSNETEEAATRHVYEAFSQAVRRRARDHVSLSFLTGGLDSRCIVGELRRQGSAVHSFCFGLDRSQDVVFSAQFAEAVGSIHRRVPVPPSGTAPYPTPEMLPLEVARTQKIWSGDGGSVGLGHVYLTRPMIERLRAGEKQAAIQEFCEHNRVRVPARVLSKAMPNPDEMLRAAIADELSGVECEDPGRILHLFLLHNDQRRHLSKHFENIDLHQWELQLPFFDADLLATIIATPIEWCLGHRLYNRMLPYVGAAAVSVPWQAYPGHETCPLPVSSELSYQWQGQESNPRHQAVRRELLAKTRRMLRAPCFPADLLDRRSVRAAYWLTRLRIRDYQYVLGAADVYETRWRTASTDAPRNTAAPAAASAIQLASSL